MILAMNDRPAMLDNERSRLSVCHKCGGHKPCRCHVCGAFVRRVKPHGVTVTCKEAATVETWAIGPNGDQVFHQSRCAKHPDKARYGAKEGWTIEYRPVGHVR